MKEVIGFWVPGGYLDPNNTNCLSSETLELFAEENIYIITAVRKDGIGTRLSRMLNLCRDFDIEIHLSPLLKEVDFPLVEPDIENFVNIWSFEDLREDIFN